MTYDIVLAKNRDELIILVNRLIKAGWKPLGPPFIHDASLAQALVTDYPKADASQKEESLFARIFGGLA